MSKRLPGCKLKDNKIRGGLKSWKMSPHLRRNPPCTDCRSDRPEFVCTRCGKGFCSLCTAVHCCCGEKVEPIQEEKQGVLRINTRLTGERFADGSGWKLDSEGNRVPRGCTCGWQDMDHTYTPGERQLDTRLDCQPVLG